MTDTTTIQITTDIRDELEARKQADESFNTVVRRLLGDAGQLWTEEEIRHIAIDEIESMRSGR